jgi:hypothetical protein
VDFVADGGEPITEPSTTVAVLRSMMAETRTMVAGAMALAST